MAAAVASAAPAAHTNSSGAAAAASVQRQTTEQKIVAYLKRIRFYEATATPQLIAAGVNAADVKELDAAAAATVKADYIPTADPVTLNTICRCHALSVPFENLNIHRGIRYDLSPDALYDKIVTRRLGGFCFELNGLLGWLLESLGYRVSYCIAQINRSPGIDGYASWSPYTHLILVVRLPRQSPVLKATHTALGGAPPHADGLGYENETEEKGLMWACDVGQGWHPGGAIAFHLNTPQALPDEWAYLLTRSGDSPFFFPPAAASEQLKQFAPPQSVLDRYARALLEDHKLTPGTAAPATTTSAAPLFPAAAPVVAAAAAGGADGAAALPLVAPAVAAVAAHNTHALNNPIAAAPPPPDPALPPAPTFNEHEMRPRFASDSVWYVLHRYSPALGRWIPRVQFPWFTQALQFPDDSVDPMNRRVLHPTSPFFRDVAATTLSTTRMLTVAGLKLITTKLPYGPKTDRPLKDAAEAIAVLKAEHKLDVDSDAERARGVLRFGGWPFQHNSTPAASNRPVGTRYHVHNGSVCELTSTTAGAVVAGAAASVSVGVATPPAAAAPVTAKAS